MTQEYTIYNESLVKYALRNVENGQYIYQGTDADNELSIMTTYRLDKVELLDTIDDAKDLLEEVKEFYEEDDEAPEQIQIRKIKVVDIGELYE